MSGRELDWESLVKHPNTGEWSLLLVGEGGSGWVNAFDGARQEFYERRDGLRRVPVHIEQDGNKIKLSAPRDKAALISEEVLLREELEEIVRHANEAG